MMMYGIATTGAACIGSDTVTHEPSHISVWRRMGLSKHDEFWMWHWTIYGMKMYGITLSAGHRASKQQKTRIRAEQLQL